ncbi:MAG TPA: DEAD/DEAH box helicase [Candidatus Omnitrophota bacterium]|nr:DEAD/DEAH box helicase [Candidatus Omnitrophota bacterium]
MQSLFKHQSDAVEFAVRNNGCCALFHDPGLGKTRTCLEIFKRYRQVNPGLRLLVVCPLSLVNSAWGEDIRKFTEFSSMPLKQIKNEKPDIIIVNYEALISKKYLPKVMSHVFGNSFMCVLDESSRLKNNKSVTTKTLLELTEYFRYRIIASGTPMPNSEAELWGQIRFVSPYLLHKSFYAFRNSYFHLERYGERKYLNGQFVSKHEMREILSQGWKYTITAENRRRLMEEVSPVTHWVKKSEALDLPEKIDEVREVELSAKEWTAYEEMRDFLITEIEGHEIAAQVVLAKLMKLRQATSGFFYSESGEAVPIDRPSKLKELEEILEELGNQQVIIWVQFHEEVRVIEKMISEKYGADQVTTLYSGTKDRDESINRFKSGSVRYLIAHPRSAAHGLTFVSCKTMVFYSLDYSYEAHAQARDRIHRIGQRNSCLYIYMVARETIDEELVKVLQKKQGLQDAVYAIVRNKTKKSGH